MSEFVQVGESGLLQPRTNLAAARSSMPPSSLGHARSGDAGYRGASDSKRELVHWNPMNASADMTILPGKERAEARARDLTRNNGFASGAVDSAKDRIVGHRYKLNLQPNYQGLGISLEAAQDWAKQFEAMFHAYADDPDCWIDAARKRTFTQLIRDSEAGNLIAGESFTSREWREDNPTLKTCFQSIEPARISTPIDIAIDDRDIREGVELGKYSDPIAYHVRTSHPLDYPRTGVRFDQLTDSKWQRIQRFNEFGYQNIFHIFEHEDAGHQTRGISRFAPVLQQFKMLGRYEDASLEAAIISAVYTFFIQSKMPESDAFAALGDYGEQLAYFMQCQAAADEKNAISIDGNHITALRPDEELKAIKPEHPISGFESFESAMLRHISRSTGTSFEQLSGDYSKTTYSSARAAMHEAWGHITSRREVGASKLATHIMRSVMDEMVLTGRMPLPAGVTDYRAARPFLSQCKWIGAGRSIIDEVKSANANKIRLENGETTLAQICAEQGLEWDEVLQQRAREKRLMAELGLTQADVTEPMAQEVETEDE